MKLTRFARALSLSVVVSACSQSEPGTGGSAGSGGAGSGTGGTTQGIGGSGGSGGSGSGGSGSGGSSSGGSTGSGGAVSTGGSDGGAVDVSVDLTPEVNAGPTKQWSCPAPPFPTNTMGPAMAVCAGFQFRYTYHEGPTWLAKQNAFFFSNFQERNGSTGDIIKVDFTTRQCEIFVMNAGCNGLAVNANGKIACASHLEAAITEYDPVTKEKKVLANKFMTTDFDSPNDIVVHSNGTIYFTNPIFEDVDGMPDTGPATLRIDPMGVVHLIARGASNGIGLSPDERTLHVVGAGNFPLDLEGIPGPRSGNGPGGDGISIDCAGRIFNQGTNSAFGGPDGKTMFVVSRGGLAFHQMAVPGLP